MKRIVILGSTGSIGQSTLSVIRRFPNKFKVVGLSTNSNINILFKQIKEFHPVFVCVKDIDAARQLKFRLGPGDTKIFIGSDNNLRDLLKDNCIDRVVLAISGSAALLPLLQAIKSGKDIALANKEALVMAGSIIVKMAKSYRVKILPVDSEQSAIWQCLEAQDKNKLKNIYLTASGGPFRNFSRDELKNITTSDALKHPCWKMGKKISVDSATLMNKGLEVLETMHLFDVRPDKIKILIHPEAIIHSMVEFVDGVILAQLSITDMRIPIQYAISYPERLSNGFKSVNFLKLKSLTFQKPDFKRFRCLELAYRVANQQGTAPSVLNAANEVCVNEFLKNRLDFVSIPNVIARVLDRHRNKKDPDLSDILEADKWAREETYKIIYN